MTSVARTLCDCDSCDFCDRICKFSNFKTHGDAVGVRILASGSKSRKSRSRKPSRREAAVVRPTPHHAYQPDPREDS